MLRHHTRGVSGNMKYLMEIEYFKKLSKRQSLYNKYDCPMKKYIPSGCTLTQIEVLQERCRIRLPKAYKEYLFLIGENHRLYDSGIGFCYDEIEDIQEEALSLVKEEGYVIKDDFWVIDILYNDHFHFFYLKDGDNPSIYHWIGSDEKYFDGYENGLRFVDEYFNVYIEKMIPSKLEKFIESLINLM